MRKKLFGAIAAAGLALSLAACGGGGEGSGDYPSEKMDWTIAFGPGGGNDIMARKMADIIKKEDLYDGQIVLTNREGGSGATGWGHLFGQKGSGYGISTTSGSFITTPLQADTGWTYEDFTPVGLFATDDALFVVPGKSDISSWEDWVDFAKSKDKVVVGGISTVNVDFILHTLIADAMGYEIDYVPFNEEGQLQTALLSGSLDGMVSNTGSILGQVEAGEVKPLLFTGKERLEALPDIPAAGEKGMEDLPAMPRGMILPPDAPEEATTYWVDTMKKVVETPEWQEYIESNYLTENILWEEDFTSFLKDTSDEFTKTLKDAGAI